MHWFCSNLARNFVRITRSFFQQYHVCMKCSLRPSNIKHSSPLSVTMCQLDESFVNMIYRQICHTVHVIFNHLLDARYNGTKPLRCVWNLTRVTSLPTTVHCAPTRDTRASQSNAPPQGKMTEEIYSDKSSVFTLPRSYRS